FPIGGSPPTSRSRQCWPGRWPPPTSALPRWTSSPWSWRRSTRRRSGRRKPTSSIVPTPRHKLRARRRLQPRPTAPAIRQPRPHPAPQAAREAEAPAVPDRSGDPQAQLAAAHARIAWLEQSLVQQRNEANGREERLKRTIAVLQQRTDALTRLASAAADRPGE